MASFFEQVYEYSATMLLAFWNFMAKSRWWKKNALFSNFKMYSLCSQ